jgi:hypothetical protein
MYVALSKEEFQHKKEELYLALSKMKPEMKNLRYISLLDSLAAHVQPSAPDSEWYDNVKHMPT